MVNLCDYKNVTEIVLWQMIVLLCLGFLLDSLARQYLWQIGLDYRHGTGHGVGSFLNVHEGLLSLTSSATIFRFVTFVEADIISFCV